MPHDDENLSDFSNIARLLNYNRKGTINFLKEKGVSDSNSLSFNFDKLREVESFISDRGIEEAKRFINQYAR